MVANSWSQAVAHWPRSDHALATSGHTLVTNRPQAASWSQARPKLVANWSRTRPYSSQTAQQAVANWSRTRRKLKWSQIGQQFVTGQDSAWPRSCLVLASRLVLFTGVSDLLLSSPGWEQHERPSTALPRPAVLTAQGQRGQGGGTAAEPDTAPGQASGASHSWQ